MCAPATASATAVGDLHAHVVAELLGQPAGEVDSMVEGRAEHADAGDRPRRDRSGHLGGGLLAGADDGHHRCIDRRTARRSQPRRPTRCAADRGRTPRSPRAARRSLRPTGPSSGWRRRPCAPTPSRRRRRGPRPRHRARAGCARHPTPPRSSAACGRGPRARGPTRRALQQLRRRARRRRRRRPR